MKKIVIAGLTGFFLAAGCTVDKNRGDERPERGVAVAATPDSVADLAYADEVGLTPEELERGRLDSDWTAVVSLDTTGGAPAAPNPEKWEQISPQQVNRTPIFLPLSGDVAGPSVLRVQILLDRALFSPGIMDGRWGKNTVKAVYFFQQREGLRTTGRVDSLTFNRLVEAAGRPRQLAVQHRLTAEDVKGPFIPMPDSIYEQAELDCSCYESLTEKLSELFHATPELLEKLNPNVDLDNLQAGQSLWVPNVRDPGARAQGEVAQLVVSGQGSYVHAVDASGRILYHFPSTLGSTYDPSPSGQFTVRRVTKKPWWHFQPQILANVPDSKPEARIPPGPNNRVGMVWMALSAPHYGIHGTNKPETIGYATSAGCVRLTNWDALFLADRIRPGTPVRFRDIQGRRGGQEFGGQRSTSADSAAEQEAGEEKDAGPAAPGARGGEDRDTGASKGRSGSGGTGGGRSGGGRDRDTTKTR
ncbi:MAG TPA: L,D-transpeptidase family protein [Longimicrobium sp.]|jgi:lipoprotein-anchoring transpeptidase ErfK/SrfK